MNNLFNPQYEGFAQGNGEMMELLTKALSAGSGVDAGSFTGGRALIPESLDHTLVNILHTMEDAPFFQALKKTPVKSPVHQWDQRTQVGADDGAWVAEGGDSQEMDQTIARKYVTAKYLQTLRKVTLQMASANSIEDAVALEKQAGTLWLIRNVEKALYDGDSALIAEQPDGLKKLIGANAGNIVDMRGADGTSSTMEDVIAQGCRIIRANFGRPNLLLTSLAAMEDVQKLLRDRVRVNVGTAQSGSVIFERYDTPFGKPSLKEDIFLQEGAAPAASSLSSLRPTAPTHSGARAAGSHGGPYFDASTAGSYYYQVVASNKYGDSVASAAANVTSIVAADEVTVTCTDGGTVGTAWKIYRSKKNAADGTDCRFAFSVARTGNNQAVYDGNAELPGTSSAYLLTMDSIYDAIEWVQFLPMMKFDLYPTNAAVFPFLMLLFGALALKKPVQMVRIRNIAPSALGWF
jgi:hypothetical protein